MNQRDEDVRVLNDLFGEAMAMEAIPEAFEDMFERLLDGRLQVLTPKQRQWVNGVASRFGVEESEGPEEDGGPVPTRLTEGPIPRGKEVPLLVKDKPLRPPSRR